MLTESGRSFDRNWMVCRRKLDGLLTETGRFIDGYSPVDFLHFGGLKVRYLPRSETHGFEDT